MIPSLSSLTLEKWKRFIEILSHVKYFWTGSLFWVVYFPIKKNLFLITNILQYWCWHGFCFERPPLRVISATFIFMIHYYSLTEEYRSYEIYFANIWSGLGGLYWLNFVFYFEHIRGGLDSMWITMKYCIFICPYSGWPRRYVKIYKLLCFTSRTFGVVLTVWKHWWIIVIYFAHIRGGLDGMWIFMNSCVVFRAYVKWS